MASNVRVVLINFVYKNEMRGEVQVKLVESHWSSIKTISKGDSIGKIRKAAEHELQKLKWRSALDSAFEVADEIAEFEIRQPFSYEAQ